MHVIDLGWVALHYTTLCGFGEYRKTPPVIFTKIIFADSLQWPVCNYLLCNKKDSSHCNYPHPNSIVFFIEKAITSPDWTGGISPNWWQSLLPIRKCLGILRLQAAHAHC